MTDPLMLHGRMCWECAKLHGPDERCPFDRQRPAQRLGGTLSRIARQILDGIRSARF